MGENYYIKKAVVIGIIFFLTCTTSGYAMIQSSNDFIESASTQLHTNYDAELPVWNIGDQWTYQIDFSGTQGDNNRFDVSIDTLILEVVSMSDSCYALDLTVPRGQITGNVRLEYDLVTIEGEIINTKMEGMLSVKKASLEIVDCQMTIDGNIHKFIDIPFTVDVTLQTYDDSLEEKNFSSLQFPLNTGMQWEIPTTYLVANMSLNLLPEDISIFLHFPTHQQTCTEWETLTLEETVYDALKISSDLGQNSELYYAVSAGNIIALDYQNIDAAFDITLTSIELTLLSTTYTVESNTPNPPEILEGATEPAIGTEQSYTFQSNDPDNDDIKYIINWGDGTTDSTSFFPSGEIVEISHIWSNDGIFSVKAKARDKYGSESSWSEEYLVTVTNDAPEKPSTPTGPTSGAIKQSYTYITSAIDSNAHLVQYGWDWDGDGYVDEWTGLHASGVEIQTDHTWYNEGSYSIKVKAKDEFGKESSWSDPLSVTMPKQKWTSIGDILSSYYLEIRHVLEQYIS